MQNFRRLTTAPAIRSFLARTQTVSSRQFVRRLSQNSGQGAAGHTHGKRSSDLPWMISAIAVTVPATFYLLSGSPKPAHHSSTAHDHATESEDPEDSKAASTTTSEEEVPSDEVEDTKQVDSADQDTERSTSNTGDQASEVTEEIGEKADEAKNKSEVGVVDAASGVKEKAREVTGETKKNTDNNSDERNSKEDDTKDDADTTGGEGKKTSNSGSKEPGDERKTVEKSGKETKSQTLERLNKENSNKKPSEIDPPAAGMKDVTSMNMQSGKQEGISNGDTWHSVLHSERGQSISKKSEGVHETAKLKGTVDPFRPVK